MVKRQTTLLLAAKNGIAEMVKEILRVQPGAIHDKNFEGKNVVLLAVENRQPHIYQFLLTRYMREESVFGIVDNEGNSALHLAATLGKHRPWLIPGVALQMQWELKWFEFVKTSMPLFFVHYNKKRKTPKEVFTETHEKLVDSGRVWIISTSNSCCSLAAAIAAVAFATSTTVPGGLGKDNINLLSQGDKLAFNTFAISSLIALSFSMTAMLIFLSFPISRYHERDFLNILPRKILLGLTLLMISIASILISFYAGHFFVYKDKLKYATFPIYAVTGLPVTIYSMFYAPWYFHLISAILGKVPQYRNPVD